MTEPVFPTLAGLGWSVKRTPVWKTRTQQAISGKETRLADWSYPAWRWELTFDFLRADPVAAEFQALAGFFNARQGAFGTFLYADADDNAVTGQTIATGDGATTAFQLVRAFGGFIEPVLAPNVVSAVTLAGVAQAPSAYSVDAAMGLLTFTAAPASGAAVAADFSYYFRCRFAEDTLDFEKFMATLYRAQKLAFVSLK
ncbi:MAG TPA: DUF2460 domain-containing protein [Candidatus Binataceae bacterium]|nr:DUF2460 domain-containing protein [Candidatus Binataceae bacterium]